MGKKSRRVRDAMPASRKQVVLWKDGDAMKKTLSVDLARGGTFKDMKLSLEVRRRVCAHCAKRAYLSEPRYLVCSGCGAARYCSEACQRADWAEHQKKCPAGQPGWNAAVDSR